MDGGGTITITADSIPGYTCVGGALSYINCGEWFRHSITSVNNSNPEQIKLGLSKNTGDWCAFTLTVKVDFFYIRS